MQIEQVDLQAPYLGKIVGSKIIPNLTDQQKEVLLKALPEGQQRKDFLMKNVQSPQFQQAMEALDDAVNSYECAAIFHSFGIYDEEIFRTSKDRWIISCWSVCFDDGEKVQSE